MRDCAARAWSLTLARARSGSPLTCTREEFCVRNDMGCGSTIGPITSAKIGLKAVDVGTSQWSMHSVREQCGTDDCYVAYEHFRSFFDEATGMLAKVGVDHVFPSCYAVENGN